LTFIWITIVLLLIAGIAILVIFLFYKKT